MDAVVSSLLSTANQLDPRVVPLTKDSVVREERWYPLCEAYGIFASHWGGPPWHDEIQKIPDQPTRPQQGRFAKAPELMACVPFFARHADEVAILPRRVSASFADLALAKQEALAATMIEVATRSNICRKCGAAGGPPRGSTEQRARVKACGRKRCNLKVIEQ